MRNLNQIKSLKSVELLDDKQLSSIKGGNDKLDWDIFNDLGGISIGGYPVPGDMDDKNP